MDEGMVRESGMNMYTLLYLKWIKKDLRYSIWNSAQCYVAAWMRGEFGGECLHIYVWLSSIATHLKLSQHYLSAIQFSSVTQSCPTLCNPMDCSTPGLPVHHQFPELT